jgi:ATP-dependent RNA helicase RhlE
LATQIFESFGAYGRNLALRHAVVFGGVSQGPQIRKLRAGVDVLVATPGRLLDLIDQAVVDLQAIEVLVLDEADRMLDMGFIRDIRRVIERLPSRRQTLLFSATMPMAIRRLADAILRGPVSVQAGPETSPVEATAQSLYLVARKNKPILLERLLRHPGMRRTLVFTRTKYGADKLVRVLRRLGIEAGAIHGNKNQSARTRALDRFKSGATPVLVATDVASRGIDVDEITHVVNFDIPNLPETYIHRIGRTARAGASGTALSFCDHDERESLRAIERLIQIRLEISADEPDLALAAPSMQLQPRGHKAPLNTTTDRNRPHMQRGPRRGRSQSPTVNETDRPPVAENPKEVALPRNAKARRPFKTRHR